jgi:hypothetical protein
LVTKSEAAVFGQTSDDAVIRSSAGRVLLRQRIVAGLNLSVFLISVTNYYFDLGLFGRFSKTFMTLAIAALYIQLHFYAPSIFRLRAYRRLKRGRAAKAAA